MSNNLNYNSNTIRVIKFISKTTSTKHSYAKSQPTTKLKQSKCTKNSNDIFEINKQIIDLLDKEYTELPHIKKKATHFEWIANNSKDDIERQIASSELEKLTTQINLIESGYREAKYIYRTEKLIEEYKQILAEPIKIDFMGNKNIHQQTRKKDIIMEFLNVAKDYIPVQPVEGQTRSMMCKTCKIDLQLEDDYLFVCPSCGYAIKHLASVASYQENNRINVAQRYVYDKRAHFGDSIKKFQAKQNTTILPTVYEDLWSKLESHEIPIEKLTKDHLYEFLKLTGHSDHYEDITLIYCEMTSKPAPNISSLEEQLFCLFDQVDPVYERVKPPKRVNFLNGQFVLFKLLQKLKYQCSEEDFYILKTREKMLEHDQIWKKICAELSWTYIATV